jgi:predicted phosphodiesterase
VRRKRFDGVLMLGDMVGLRRRAQPVVDAVRGLPERVYSVRGNHDKVVRASRAATTSTRRRWSPRAGPRPPDGEQSALRARPAARADGDRADLAICHGSPLDEDTYVFSAFEAFEIFSRARVPVTFFGHTHVPSLFAQRGENVRVALLAAAARAAWCSIPRRATC